MSSQTLATAPLGGGGLPESPSPPAPNLDPSWPTDHMETTAAPQDTHESAPFPPDQPHHERSISSSNANNTQQHRQALNNLLAALNPANAPSATPVQTAPPAEAVIQAENAPLANATALQQSESKPSNHDPSNQPSTPPQHATNVDMEPLLAQSTFMDLPPLPPLSNISPPTADSQFPVQPPLHIPDPIMDPTTPPRNYRREIEAFAKLEFVDGEFYITTWQVELGRDLLAYRDAVEREKWEKENPHGQSQSSSGRVSRPSDRIRREPDSQVQGSVVSEIGGFGGIDEAPVKSHDENVNENGQPSHSSQVSASDVVKPGDIFPGARAAGFINDFDYNLRGKQVEAFEADNEKPAPVTADHLPNANICPLVPIHANVDSVKSEVELHKGISRRHVRIEWDMEDACFKMRVLGRNGAFLNDKWVRKGHVKQLENGSKIQLSGITATFRLPRPKTPSLPSEPSIKSDMEGTPPPPEATPIPQESGDTTPAPKINLKITAPKPKPPPAAPPAALPEPLIGPDGQPIVRKRGPGRPPKDGIMSTRERKEREKAAKLAEAKAANGGKTPPPLARNKLTKPPTKEELARAEAKLDKRKYTKRKRDEDGEVIQSIEGGEENVPSDTERIPVKKPKQSKSPSPEYPPLATLSEENLARPSDPYARLIYDILIDIYPKALPLKQIYRALKLKYPFFVYRVESDGWQSSVRHNLNQEWNKLFEKGEKEGKGFAWKAIPGALQPQAERKRAAQAAAAAKPKPQPPRQPPQQGAPGNWQNQSPYPYWQGQNGYPAPPQAGMPWPSQSGAGQPGAPPQQNGQPPQQYPPSVQNPQVTRTARATSGAQGSPYPAASGQHNKTTPQSNAQPAKPPLGPPASSSGSAPHNMPCTLDGYLAIRRFEQAMYDMVATGRNPNMDQWKAVFSSAYSRLLHGAPSSTVPGGETKEEVVVMGHMKTFIETYRNPQFKGFRSQSRDGTPLAAPTANAAPAHQTPAAAPSAQNSTPQAALNPSQAPHNTPGQPPISSATTPAVQATNGAAMGNAGSQTPATTTPSAASPTVQPNTGQLPHPAPHGSSQNQLPHGSGSSVVGTTAQTPDPAPAGSIGLPTANTKPTQPLQPDKQGDIKMTDPPADAKPTAPAQADNQGDVKMTDAAAIPPVSSGPDKSNGGA